MSYWGDEIGRKKGTALLKYLMVQFVAGRIILGSLLLSEDWWQVLLVIALALKMGLIPLHSWVVDIFGAISLWEGFYLSVVSKVGPFILMLQWLPSDWIFPLRALSIVRRSFMGIIYSDTRHIIACSSIIGTRWVVTTLSQGAQLGVMSIYLYAAQSALVIWSLQYFEGVSLSKIATGRFYNHRHLHKSIGLALALMANLRLPSYTFFVLKLYVILETKWYFLLLGALLASSLSLIWYARMINVLWVTDAHTYAGLDLARRTVPFKLFLYARLGFIILWIRILLYWFSIIQCNLIVN